MADTTIGSYEISTVPGGIDTELERLRQQALQWWDQEARTLRALGLRDGMHILEPGAGPGFITEQLLRTLPTSRITVVERDPVMAAKSRAYLQGRELPDRDIERVRYVQASVTATGLPDQHVDFAYARLLFQHLPDPVAAARELCRVLKPGGRLVVLDADDALHLAEPSRSPAIRNVEDKVGADQAAHGGNRHVGRLLPRILRVGGLRDLTFATLVQHSDILGLESVAPQRPPSYFASLVDSGLITLEERDAAVADETQFYAAESLIVLSAVVASGARPIHAAGS